MDYTSIATSGPRNDSLLRASNQIDPPPRLTQHTVKTRISICRPSAPQQYHHHHVALPARISLVLSCHPSIVHCSQEVFKATSCIGTELLYTGSCQLSCLCSSMWRGPRKYVAYEFVLTSPAVFCMSSLSNLDSFCDGWQMVVQLLFVECCLQDLFSIAHSIFV